MIIIYMLLRDKIPFYIGKTKNVKIRFPRHKYTHGTDIEIVILDEVEKDEWKFWECYWIEQFKQWGFILENKNKGGGGPKAGTRTKESIQGFKDKRKTWSRKGTPQPSTYKKRIQMALKGVPKPEGFGDMMRKVRLGVPKPEGFGEKVSKSHMGVKKPKLNKKVLCYTKEGSYITEYESIKEAAKKTNSNPSTISKVCRGIFKQTNGYKFKFKDVK